MTTMSDLTAFKDKLKETEDWLAKELAGIRTGRATPALVDGIMIDQYGSKTPLKHVASISIEDARTIFVSPWDKGNVKPIEVAIIASSLGVMPTVNDSGVRIALPALTEERRKDLGKVAKQKLEEARISLRRERDEVWSDIQEKERAGEMPEDEKFMLKEKIQEIVDATNAELDALLANKEKEIAA